MKEIKKAVTITAIFAVLYLVFAFITLEINPFQWDGVLRMVYVVVGCYFVLIYLLDNKS